MTRTTRVLVVDDSSVARDGLTQILHADGAIEVVGQAANGADAIELVDRLRPDLVTMDIQMPVMDGLTAIERIMAYTPTPVLVVTGDPRGDGLTFEALQRGALDLVTKPTVLRTRHEAAHDVLRRKVKLLATIPVVRHVAGRQRDAADTHVSDRIRQHEGRARIVSIVASTGGPQALPRILSRLPADYPIGIAIVQHITEGFTDGLAKWLDALCALDVRVPGNGDELQPGQVFIAPSQKHMRINHEGRARLITGDPVSGHLPSGDVLLESVAESYGAGAIGMILTGMQRDGATGMKAIHTAGGLTIAQDEASSLVFGMPQAAIAMGAVDKVLPLDDIAGSLVVAAGLPVQTLLDLPTPSQRRIAAGISVSGRLPKRPPSSSGTDVRDMPATPIAIPRTPASLRPGSHVSVPRQTPHATPATPHHRPASESRDDADSGSGSGSASHDARQVPPRRPGSRPGNAT